MPRKADDRSQRSLFEEEQDGGADRTSTFQDNLSLPIHRWFRYSAGFSALWVRELLERERAHGRKKLLDPFAGSGTAVLEGELCGFEARGVEAHPFVARVAQAKLCWRENAQAYLTRCLEVLGAAEHTQGKGNGYPELIRKCFPPDVLALLDALRRTWENAADGSTRSELVWLTLASVLRSCSPVGTAQWQYVLPNKTKAKAADPYQAFEAKAYSIREDMAWRQRQERGPAGQISTDDARECASIPDGWADLVVTSPPYANNYDYADATRLEMTFFGEIDGWGGLQEAVRKLLVRSCTQHVAPLAPKSGEIIEDSLLVPIRRELAEACGRLAVERESHGGKKPYHTMVAAYFQDMAKVWVALRRVTAKGGLVCYVIGDSAPYGVYVPVDRWLGELAVAAGFQSFRFEKTRDRNVKWKNRKHRVPLHEGRLWVDG
jgi:hypothetical protein